MKFANTPRVVPADASIMMSQKLSWASGQWYFRRRSTTTMSVAMVSPVATIESRTDNDPLAGRNCVRMTAMPFDHLGIYCLVISRRGEVSELLPALNLQSRLCRIFAVWTQGFVF